MRWSLIGMQIVLPALVVAPACRLPAVEKPGSHEMVFIAGGTFTTGSGHEHVIEPFYMDRTEVTVRAYRACVRDGACAARTTYLVESWNERIGENVVVEQRRYCNYSYPGRRNHPMNCIGAADAVAYCGWAGKRLPTEWEWEWAARGREEARRFPWGDASPSCNRAVMADEHNRFACGRRHAEWRGTYGTWPVGAKSGGASRDGVLDLAGNVTEFVWVAPAREFSVRGSTFAEGTWPELYNSRHHHAYPYDPKPQDPPRDAGTGPETGLRCVKASSTK